MPRRRLLAAHQIAVSERTNGTPGTRELDPRYRRENRSIHRSRCRLPARLACAPAAGSAGYAGRGAELTHPQRHTSAATAVTSGGMAGPGAWSQPPVHPTRIHMVDRGQASPHSLHRPRCRAHRVSGVSKHRQAPAERRIGALGSGFAVWSGAPRSSRSALMRCGTGSRSARQAGTVCALIGGIGLHPAGAANDLRPHRLVPVC